MTAERVRQHLAEHVNGDVTRYEVPSVCGLQLVCTHALAGGVTTSLALDSHGKTLSSRRLGMIVEAPAHSTDAPLRASAQSS